MTTLRQLAEETVGEISNPFDLHSSDADIVERALLEAIRQFAQGEPSDAMVIIGYDKAYRPHGDGSKSVTTAYKAMLAQALKELEQEV